MATCTASPPLKTINRFLRACSQHDEADACDAWGEWARQLYPGNAYLQGEWLRAVAIVRATKRGWLLEPVPHLRLIHTVGARA